MSEIPHSHNQAGVQVGEACWELFCLEHGIGCDGEFNTPLISLKFYSKLDGASLSRDLFL